MQQLDKGDYTLLSIGNMFIDCADRVLEADATEEPTLKKAMVCAREKTAFAANKSYHQEKGATHLRVVDPYTDEGVWALVDDCCNSCTHSAAWRENAEVKWAKLGFKSYWVDSRTTNFTGVGQRTSTGKYKLPMGLRFPQSNLVVPGGLDSH